MGLTASELNRARADAARFLPSRGTIRAYTATSNDAGGGSIAWQNRATIDCRAQPMGGNEEERGERISEQSDWIITLAGLTVVEVEEELLIEGERFSVTAVRDRDYEVTKRVEARRL